MSKKGGSFSSTTCTICGEAFPSRNKLFKHVAICTTGSKVQQAVRDGAIGSAAKLMGTNKNRTGTNSTKISSYLYVVGGRLRGRTLRSVERFCFTTQQWQECPLMKDGRGSHGAASTQLGGVLYSIGGGGFDSNLSSCEAYYSHEIANDFQQLQKPQQLPEGEEIRVSNAVGTDTGMSSEGESGRISVKGEWRCVAPLAVSRHALAVLRAQDSRVAGAEVIYAVGGWVDGKECSAAVERYSPLTDTWEACAPLLLARRLHGAAAFPADPSTPAAAAAAAASTTAPDTGEISSSRDNDNDNGGKTVSIPAADKIYVFGGHCNDPHWHTDTAEEFDPLSNTWRRISSMPAAGGASAVTLLPFIFVFLHGRGVLRYDPATDTYLRLSALPLPEWHCFGATTAAPLVGSTLIYVHGGISNGSWSNAMFAYDAAQDAWTEMPPMTKARRRCASAIVHHHHHHVQQLDDSTGTTGSKSNSDSSSSSSSSSSSKKHNHPGQKMREISADSNTTSIKPSCDGTVGGNSGTGIYNSSKKQKT